MMNAEFSREAGSVMNAPYFYGWGIDEGDRATRDARRKEKETLLDALAKLDGSPTTHANEDGLPIEAKKIYQRARQSIADCRELSDGYERLVGNDVATGKPVAKTGA